MKNQTDRIDIAKLNLGDIVFENREDGYSMGDAIKDGKPTSIAFKIITIRRNRDNNEIEYGAESLRQNITLLINKATVDVYDITYAPRYTLK